MSSVLVTFRRSNLHISDALLDDLACEHSSHVSLRSDDGSEVKVHSLVLAAASPFLRELLSSEELDHSSITIQSVDFNCICLFVQFICTGEVDCCSATSATEFVELLELLGCNISLEVVQKRREIMVGKTYNRGRNKKMHGGECPIKKSRTLVNLNKDTVGMITDTMGSRRNHRETKLQSPSAEDVNFSNEHIFVPFLDANASNLTSCINNALANQSTVPDSNEGQHSDQELGNESTVEEVDYSHFSGDNDNISESGSTLEVTGEQNDVVGIGVKQELLYPFSELPTQNISSSSLQKMKQLCDKEVRILLTRIVSDTVLADKKIAGHQTKNGDQIPPNKVLSQMDKCSPKVPELDTNSDLLHTPSHPCPRCSESFRSAYKLICHIKSSHLTCAACRVSFTAKGEQLNHKCLKGSSSMKINPENKCYPCKLCKRVFTRREKQLQHQTHKHGLFEKLLCKQCDSYFQTRKEFFDHKMIHLPPGYKYSCDDCAQVLYFRNRKRYEAHRSVVHLIDRCLCPFCKQILPLYYDAESHIAKTCPTLHKVSKERNCDHCNMRLSNLGTLNKHLLSVHGIRKEYICKLCNNRQFDSFIAMVHHRRVKHPHCHHCKKRFINKQAAREHQRNCDNRRKFQCSNCGHQFREKNVFEAHQQNKCQRVRCDECGKYLLNLNILKQHMANVHQTPVICDHCQKPCKSKQRLLLHIAAMHMSYDQRPFKCPHSDCNAAFVQQFRLREHLKGQKHSPEMYANTMNNRINSASQL